MIELRTTFRLSEEPVLAKIEALIAATDPDIRITSQAARKLLLVSIYFTSHKQRQHFLDLLDKSGIALNKWGEHTSEEL